MIIEEETGTYTSRTAHPHNGYYAGDFSSVPFQQPDLGALLSLAPGSAGHAHRSFA